MTTPARCFSPLDMARRRPIPPAASPTEPAAPPAATVRPTAQEQPVAGDRPLSAADAVRPGKLRKAERMRPMYEQGMRISRMLPEARLVALTLLGYANFQTGTIHVRFRPTPEALAYATGLTTGQVQVQLQVLTSRGWLCERTLASGPRAGARIWQLCIPAVVLQQIRDRATQATPQTAPTG